MSDTNGDGHVIPSETAAAVLNSLYPRGYVFFGINENGKIDTIEAEKDPVQSLGLKSYIIKWHEAQDEIDAQMIMQECVQELGHMEASGGDEQSLQA